MKSRLLSFAIIFLLFIISNLFAFEIPFPEEEGFYIGKPMNYVVTGTAGEPNTIGKEGTYTFGTISVLLNGDKYYRSIFNIGTGRSTFLFGVDSVNKVVTQKNISFDDTELDINPAMVALKYPLHAGRNWNNSNQKSTIVAKNVVIPGLGKFPAELKIENVIAETIVIPVTITVPAGTFDTLMVETVYNGSLLGIPSTIIQRTWMSQDNVPIKRSFEFTKPTKLMVYEMELSKPHPDIYDLNWDGIVNMLDLMIVIKNYGKKFTSIRIPNPDVNMDNVVDLEDMKMIISHFGEVYK